MKFIQKIYSINSLLQGIKEELSEKIYLMIPNSTLVDRRVLLSIRRDIYNNRPLKSFTNLPKGLTPLLKRYDKLQKILSRYEEKYKKDFSKELERKRQVLLQAVKKASFQKGLLLSSTSLYSRVHSPDTAFSDKEERSLIKYLSRVATKPTPFSTFTDISYATINRRCIKTLLGNSKRKRSTVHLNNYIYEYLLNLLLLNKDINRHFPLKLNQSIRITGENITFIINNNNNEALQSLTRNDLLSYLLKILKGARTYSLDELISKLRTIINKDTSDEDLENYLREIISYGFLIYDIPVSKRDSNWVNKISIFLRNNLPEVIRQVPSLKKLFICLKKLENLQNTYASLSTAKRFQSLTTTYEILKETVFELHREAKLPEDDRLSFFSLLKNQERKKIDKNEPFPQEYQTRYSLPLTKVLYEDSYRRGPSQLPIYIEEDIKTLGDLFERLNIYNDFRETQKISNYFLSKFGSKSINFIDFYKNYLKDKEDDKRKQHFINKHLEKVVNRIVNKFAHSLNKDVLHLAKNDFPRKLESSPTSLGAFFQIDERQIVLNAVSSGYGRIFSRFLSDLPKYVTTSLKKNNSQIDKRKLIATVCDSSPFNANMHPPLTESEIVIPGCFSTFPKTKQIHLNEIVVTYDAVKKQLKLLHTKLHKEILVINLGIGVSNTRSSLYNFFNILQPTPQFSLGILITKLNASLLSYVPQEEVRILPRIVYENKVILQRRKWLIPQEKLPSLDSQVESSTVFLKINEWRKSIGIPNEVFIRLHPSHKTLVGNTPVQQVEDKPQYINFSNPFLVSLFERTCHKKISAIEITEMLPLNSDKGNKNGKRYITEFFCHWYV